MTNWRLQLMSVVIHATIAVGAAHGQPITQLDVTADVFRDHMIVRLPKPYLDVKKPDPPIEGYFAWKLSAEGTHSFAVVFRTDSAIRTTDVGEVLKHTRLYLCPTISSTVLECTTPITSTARSTTVNVIELDITEASVVERIRAGKPAILLRQTLEPAGRFRVDHIGFRYR
jgi:hypothetical protein